jgi:hypothetical protein
VKDVLHVRYQPELILFISTTLKIYCDREFNCHLPVIPDAHLDHAAGVMSCPSRNPTFVTPRAEPKLDSVSQP